MLRPEMASKVAVAAWLGAKRAASVSAKGTTAWKPLVELRTMYVEPPPEPLELLAVEPELEGWGALLPGAVAVAPPPPPTVSPTCPVRPTITPAAGE